MNMKNRVLVFILSFYTMILLCLDRIKTYGYKAGIRIFRDDCFASADSMSGVLMFFLGVMVSSVIGLAFTPQFATACTEASWAFNNSSWESILDLIFLFVLPILWAILFVTLLAGAGKGVWRIASRL